MGILSSREASLSRPWHLSIRTSDQYLLCQVVQCSLDMTVITQLLLIQMFLDQTFFLTVFPRTLVPVFLVLGDERTALSSLNWSSESLVLPLLPVFSELEVSVSLRSSSKATLRGKYL